MLCCTVRGFGTQHSASSSRTLCYVVKCVASELNTVRRLVDAMLCCTVRGFGIQHGASSSRTLGYVAQCVASELNIAHRLVEHYDMHYSAWLRKST